MKNMKKIASLVLALVMVFSLTITAFAAEKDTGKGGEATITVENAVNGETYTLVKLFDATLSADGKSIIYTGDIPDALGAYFTTNESGNIVATDVAKDGDDLTAEAVNAITTWAEGQDAYATGSADATGLKFTGLEYGYYVLFSTFGAEGEATHGAAISVTSTNPDGVIVDKNTEEPVVTKVVDDKDINIGDTVKYTATFDTVNMLDGKVVTDYIIYDTLPAFLSNVEITSIKVGNTEITKDENDDGKADTQFGTVTYEGNEYQNAILIPWATYTKTSADDAEEETGYWTSKYGNGTQIVVTYTATANENIAIGGQETTEDTSDGNVNTVTLQPYTGEPNDGHPDPYKKNWHDDAEIYTYAAALRKVDGAGNPLAGATFSATGLVVTGDNGLYVVSSYNPSGKDADENDITATVMKTDDQGYLVIEGLNSDAELVVTEVEAPAGYNKFTGTVTVKPIATTAVVESSTKTTYYDAEGNEVGSDETYASTTTVVNTLEVVKNNAENYKVVNNAGSTLPTTGGMGTTLFYVFGGILVAAAVVLLVTKKRVGEAK